MIDALTIPIGLLLLLAMVVGVAAVARAVRRSRRRRHRVVEAPNSYHTWQRVREREVCDRWRNIALERMHPLNREEVVRLLGIVEVGGSEALRPRERTFLDTMAEIAGTVTPASGRPDAAEPGEPGTHGAPDLRHRTA